MKNYTYQNDLIGKKQLRQILGWSFTKYDSMKACSLADELKYLGFKYATQAGISISIEDLRVPFVKNLMLEKANEEIINSEKILLKGKITKVEQFQKIIDTWSLTSESLKNQIIRYFKNYDPLNSVYIMAFSGARGNLSQVRQCRSRADWWCAARGTGSTAGDGVPATLALSVVKCHCKYWLWPANCAAPPRAR